MDSSLLDTWYVNSLESLRTTTKEWDEWTWRTSAVGAANSFTFSLIQDNDHSYPNGVLHPIVIAEPLWQFFSTLKLP